MLDQLERRFGRFAIPNLSLWIVVGQVFVLLAWMIGRLDLRDFLFYAAAVRAGEWWRFVTFIFMPPPPGMFGYLFVAFSWYMFYLMGNALEHYWGAFRYNLFLFLGYALTVGVAFLTPLSASTNLFLAGSVFLAFAYLNPDFEIALFLILPIKIKWIALVTWVLYAVQIVRGDWATRFVVLASVGNFLIFFARDIVHTMRYRQRSMQREVRRMAEDRAGPQARHICYVCGKTDLTNPEMDFRYCSKCAGDQCYCPEHIFKHEHVLTEGDAKKD